MKTKKYKENVANKIRRYHKSLEIPKRWKFPVKPDRGAPAYYGIDNETYMWKAKYIFRLVSLNNANLIYLFFKKDGKLDHDKFEELNILLKALGYAKPDHKK